jgi:hypothetical protein
MFLEPAGPTTKEKIKKLFLKLKEPFRQIIEGSKTETGSDYFTPIFLVGKRLFGVFYIDFIELVSFVFLVIFQQDFTGVPSTQVSEVRFSRQF